ncbi:hypothetical protein M9Y10_003051 [Tritrichomonas musculus]|uniref:Myb-like DNA-binding domain containing protein n=1 Tax=Tritrichomonas musculus TaxID=1915356 RepID=A0ABR2JNI0_9EUKA
MINNIIYPNSLKSDSNFQVPVFLTFPTFSYITPFPPYYGIINTAIGNQSCMVPNNLYQNNQLLSLEIPNQVKENLISKMMSTNINLNSTPDTNDDKDKSNQNDSSSLIQNNMINSYSSLNNFCFNPPFDSQIDSGKKSFRTHFTKDEDEKIRELVKKFGTKNWPVVAAFMKGRTAKQCRDRYSNYLIPGIFQGEWSKEEDELLIKLYKEIGSKWSVIQNYFPKRSSNSIKNRWHYFLCKKYNFELENENEKDNEKDKKEDGEKEKESEINEIDNLLEINDGESQNKHKHNENSVLSNKDDICKVNTIEGIKNQSENVFEIDIIPNLNLNEDEWTLFN